MNYITRSTLEKFLERVTAVSDVRGDFFLVGQTSLVWETQRRWTDRIAVCSNIDEGARDLESHIEEVSRQISSPVVNEFPGEVVPLPEGWRERCRPIAGGGALTLAHFDPCSVSLRSIARGDEEDYQLVLAFLEHAWFTLEELDGAVTAALPRFNFETTAQDPAEFRRRYKGLQQMARARGFGA